MKKLKSFSEMRKNKGMVTYTMDDCISVVVSFYEIHGRLPGSVDIVALSKKKKSPSLSVFAQKGGLPWIIEKAGFLPSGRTQEFRVAGDVIKEFRNFVKKFRDSHNGRFPTSKECTSQSNISRAVLRNHTGMTFDEALSVLGASVRNSKLINLPPIE